MVANVTPAIPASQIVNVVDNVLVAGGNALLMIATMLTQSTRVPIGTVYGFPTAAAVADFFGDTSVEAGLSSVYFNGFENSNAKPALLNVYQYAENDVGAYLQSGNVSGIPLATLQGFTGTLSVTIDAVLKTGSVNLSTATSLSSAAQIIQNTLAILGPADGSITAAAGASATGSGSSTNLTLSATTGTIHVGSAAKASIAGTGVPANTYLVSQSSGTPGSNGVYVTNNPTTSSGATITVTSNVLDVSVVGSGQVQVGDHISGTGVSSNTYVSAQLTGTTGAAGTYTITATQQFASTAVVVTLPAAYYDSISGSLFIISATDGDTSTITFGSGAMATDLLFTQALGAVLSQGADAFTPAGAMNDLIALTQNWVTFFTTWEPIDADQEAFALWNSGQGVRYVYERWSNSVLETETGGGSVPTQYINDGNFGGVVSVYQNPNITTLDGEKAAFGAGCTASIDFTETNGVITFAFKRQDGILPDITDATEALNLAGSPLGGTYGNGVNFYGDYTTPNQAFKWYQRGLISGSFTWKDDYVNEVWFKNQCQLALMVLEDQAKSIPYVTAGYARIEAALLDPVQQALNFGMIVPGLLLSNAQIAAINTAAGVAGAAQTVVNQGFFIQVKPAIAQVRQARGSPPITIWYATGESIQAMNLVSTQVQ